MNQISLKLETPYQCKLADLLWAAQTQEEVNYVLEKFGYEARVVYELMVAAAVDEVGDTKLAQQALKKIFV